MDFILILGLAGAAAYLWQRAERLDDQLQMLELRLDQLTETLARLVSGQRDRDQPVLGRAETSQNDGAQDDDRAQANGPTEAMPAIRRAGSVAENTPDNVAASDAPATAGGRRGAWPPRRRPQSFEAARKFAVSSTGL